jgi:hypothetical protein
VINRVEPVVFGPGRVMEHPVDRAGVFWSSRRAYSTIGRVNPPPPDRHRGAARLPAGAAGVGEAAFRMRVRALNRSRPVVELATSARRAERLPDVDAIGLALAAVDLAVARQGLPDAVTYDEALDVLTRLSVVGDPTRPREDHQALAGHVLDALLNKADHQARFSYEVGNWSPGPEVAYHRSLLEFWLLREREDRGSGRLVLHADADAINALVAGLAFDVADEQAAAELVLRRQIARGEFGKAEATAQRNVQLSVQYADQLDAVLVETRRDVRAAAGRWETEVPARLHQARDHLQERLREEDTLLDHLRAVIDAPPGEGTGPASAGDAGEPDRPAVLAAAARAARLLEKCRERHLELMQRVIEAIGVFLDAQQAQAFRPPGRLHTPNLGEEVLRPLLAHPAGAAESVGAAFLTALAPSPRPMVRLVDLVDAMLAPTRVVNVHPPEPEPEGPGEETPASVPPPVLAAAKAAVRAAGLPARLSDLLRRAADDTNDTDDEAVASLVAAAALWLFSPDTAEDAGDALAFDLFGPSAMAVADGARLPVDLPGGPWYGDDLLVAASEDQLLTALASLPSLASLPRPIGASG